MRPPQGYKDATGKSAASKKATRESISGLRGCYGYWPISADKAKQRLESQAATYWGTRPPRRVNEEEDKTAPKKRIRQPVEGWHHSMAVLLGPELTKNKNLELKGFPNVVDAVAALNSGETPTPKAGGSLELGALGPVMGLGHDATSCPLSSRHITTSAARKFSQSQNN